MLDRILQRVAARGQKDVGITVIIVIAPRHAVSISDGLYAGCEADVVETLVIEILKQLVAAEIITDEQI